MVESNTMAMKLKMWPHCESQWWKLNFPAAHRSRSPHSDLVGSGEMVSHFLWKLITDGARQTSHSHQASLLHTLTNQQFPVLCGCTDFPESDNILDNEMLIFFSQYEITLRVCLISDSNVFCHSPTSGGFSISASVSEPCTEVGPAIASVLLWNSPDPVQRISLWRWYLLTHPAQDSWCVKWLIPDALRSSCDACI